MSMVIANEDMAKAWDGEEGDRWTEHAERYEAAGTDLWEQFLAAVPIATTDRVLDIGCGTGKSTRDAARAASAGSALGIDLSSRMLEYARQRSDAEGLNNVEFRQADAQVYSFEEQSFDLVISSFGAMFFADRLAAFQNIARALRPGGRLAVLAWRDMASNEWLGAIRDSLAAGRDLPMPPAGAPGPFGLTDADGVRDMLRAADFEDIELTELKGQMRYGGDADEAWAWVRTMGPVRGLSEGLDDATRKAAHERLRQVLAEHETPDGVMFGSSAWLITARRS